MRLLLRGGDLIDTEPAPVVRPGTDLLIEDGRIAAVGVGLAADAEVVDVTGMQVLPGFVDTHRHTWQEALRAAVVGGSLAEYLQVVRVGVGPRMRPSDVHVATLAGARRSLASGVTTVQDFAHFPHTPEHTAASLDALRSSGIRAVFGYGDSAAGGATRDPAAARAAATAAGGLITMALAPLGPSHTPVEAVAEDWRLADELGVRIFVHVSAGPLNTRPVELLRDNGLLRAGITFVHANSLADDELAMIGEAGATVSIAPAVEAQMGHGAPMAGRLNALGVTTGLGVDVVTTVPSDMFSLMRAGLLTSQCGPGSRWTAADALFAATLGGARTVGLGDSIGSLAVGKQADLVVYAPDPVAAWHDPIGSLVAFGEASRVRDVFVAGERVKPGPDPVDELLASAEFLVG
ncbi:amidohydrolase family protein [Labedaea rhizosphaerae]|uniref:Cytosine/adenosine deaminase-related metal-dependent hydrolase n=1 Tax=Labedaea rhizosphaerae TaxID=598644 RepID=A0A4R6SAV9_LABRH|nr:amidohydrolase family protein [Labedaea rhizosphaerae]TDP97070.1 cytosine/adenosine deaminase-related metal-dependent hydrolase [Labedaea rhizosphaerae]